MTRSLCHLLVAVLLGTAGCAQKDVQHPASHASEPEALDLHIERLGNEDTDPTASIKDPGHFAYVSPQRTVTYDASHGDGVIDTIHVDDGQGVEAVYLRGGDVFCRVAPRVCLATTAVFPVLLFESAALTQQWLTRRQGDGTQLPLAEATRLQAKLADIFALTP